MALYLPGWANIAAVVITWAIGGLLLLLGTAVEGRRAAPEFRIGAGWGALCVVLTLWGVFAPWSLRLPAMAIVIAALAAQLVPARRPTRADWRTLGRLLVLTLPLWLVMAPVRPSQVDTFLNLLPNADYLVDYARLPTSVLPPSYSMYPAAPYDTQFLAFLGSFLRPGYPAVGMSLVNVMLQLIGGLAIARVLARPAEAPSWGALGLGMLLATLLNPGFVPRFHFSSYGETGLAVTALLAACLFVDAQAARNAGERRAWGSLALILVAMINTKQSGVGLVLALAGAAVVAGVIETRTRWRQVVVETALVLVPAALIYAVWRYYVAKAGVAELVPLPFSAWNWGLVPAMLKGIAEAIGDKPLYFAASAAALVSCAVLLRRDGWTRTTRFGVFFAATFILYNGFLLATYIAHFSPVMSADAHSYFRYNTHLSLMLVLTLALVVRALCPALQPGRAIGRRTAVAVVILALLAPVAFAERLRFDIEMPQPLVWDLAGELKPYVHDGDRLAVLLPGDSGRIGELLSDYLASVPPRRRGLTILRRPTADAAALADAVSAGYDLALISCTPEGKAALMKHDADGWRELASWGYQDGIPLSPWQHSRHWPALCR
jgi:hypothetical protein